MPDRQQPTLRFALGLARAAGGAVVFTLPLYMTMEMWHLGFTIDRGRLALLTALTFPMLVGLSHVSGFEPTFGAVDDMVDAAVAWAVGIATGAVGLLLLGVFQTGQPASELIGKLTLQAIPGSIGALLAHSQFSNDQPNGALDGATSSDAEGRANGNEASGDGGYCRPDSYWSQLLVMVIGALFLAFNVAPTEEIIRIAYTLTPWHMLALIVVSLVAMHAFVYQVDARGEHEERAPTVSVAVRYTVVGYAIAVSISAYVLWTFGRLDDTGLVPALMTVLVLAVPASIGAAAARLLL